MGHSNWNCPQCHRPNISGDLIKCPSCGKKRNRWGYWDCRYCGNKQIRADHKECPGCGKPKDRDVKFYLHDDSPVEFVDEVSGESAVRIGHQNWICPYCKQQNDDSVQVCVYCAAQREESQERYHDIPAPQAAPQPNYNAKPVLAKRKKKLSPTCLGCLILALIFIVPIFGGVLIEELIYNKVREVPLQSATWESKIYVEALKTFQDSGWKDELPEDARILREQIENRTYIDHYDERTYWVDDADDNDYDYGGGNDDWDYGGGWDDGGWDDYGDGQFGMLHLPVLMIGPKPQLAAFSWEVEQVPVYATRQETKYYYEYDAWVDERTVRVTGEGNTPPTYGDLTLKDNERERGRSVSYYVTFCYKNQTDTQECSESEYYQIVKDGVVRFRIKDALTNKSFELIKPEE